MKIFAVALIGFSGLLLSGIFGQEYDNGVARKTNEADLSISVHFLDGLSGNSSDNLPDMRFLHYGCHLGLLLTNKTDKTSDSLQCNRLARCIGAPRHTRNSLSFGCALEIPYENAGESGFGDILIIEYD